jgi:hypothetical protein
MLPYSKEQPTQRGLYSGLIFISLLISESAYVLYA